MGVRETYRVVGEKTITEKDYLEGLVPEDALSWSYWMVDEHNAGTSGARLVFHEPERVGTVPLGAMLPKGVGHMLVAGRAVTLSLLSKRSFPHRSGVESRNNPKFGFPSGTYCRRLNSCKSGSNARACFP